MSGGDWTIFFTRPLSGSLLAIAVLMVGLTVFHGMRGKHKSVVPTVSQ